MAKQMRKWNPGDAANAFVRVILSDAGTMLGGLTEGEWRRTLDWFGGRCAYTGEELVDGRTDRDHAIPMNRTHCGLHLYGNVLPVTRDANRRKASAHFRDFVDDPGRLDRIETFFRNTGYWDRIAGFGDLQRYCEAQYRAINALCRVNKDYLANLLPGSPEENGAENPNRTVVEERGKTLPINPESAESGSLQGRFAAREMRVDRRDVSGRPENGASMGCQQHVGDIEHHGQPSKPPAVPGRRVAATRHRIPAGKYKEAVKEGACYITQWR